MFSENSGAFIISNDCDDYVVRNTTIVRADGHLWMNVVFCTTKMALFLFNSYISVKLLYEKQHYQRNGLF